MKKESGIAASAAAKVSVTYETGMTEENFNAKLQNLAERVDKIAYMSDPWSYDENDKEYYGVSACERIIKEDPLSIIESLLFEIETEWEINN